MVKNLPLATLGYFVFLRETLPFQSLNRETTYRHPENNVIGNLPLIQYTGKGGDSITISGKLMPEITGGRSKIELLRQMADSGSAYPLIDGFNFQFLGFFVIENITENQETFTPQGALIINFTLKLKATADNRLINQADSITDF